MDCSKIVKTFSLLYVTVPEMVAFVCPRCREEFDRKEAYQQHLKGVHQGYRIRCPVPWCSTKLASYSGLKKHFGT